MIPKNPVILSENDWGVQAPPKRIVLEGDWIPIGDDDEEEDEQIREPWKTRVMNMFTIVVNPDPNGSIQVPLQLRT